MSTDTPQSDRSTATTIGLVLSLLSGILWVIYGLTGAPRGLLVVAVVFSMLVGGWWAFGRDLIGNRRQRG